MDMNLAGRTALITGASKGIGLSIAEALAAEGVNLILAARSKELLEQNAADLTRKFKVKVETMALDLSDQAERDRLVAAYPRIFAETRGAGLLIGLKCVVANTDLVAKLREAGLLAVGAGENVMRLMPPLTITEAQLDEGVAIIDRVAKNWAPA